MRPNLLHPLVDKRRLGRRRAARLAAVAHRRVSGPHLPAVLTPAPPISAPSPAGEIPLGYDLAARRVRAAGGPCDEASYSCACGYVFAALVSTSVCCPHCGARQAW